MKNYFLWIILPMVFSCTNDDNPKILISPAMKQLQSSNDDPSNSSNTYDITGKIHNELCTAFLDAPTSVVTMEDALSVATVLAATNINFQSIVPSGYLPPSKTRLEYIFEDPNNVWEVINEAEISTKAKLSLVNFLTTVEYLSKHEDDYDDLYQFIIDYENSLASDSSFSNVELQMIYTATSIARYDYHFASLHKRKPPRDRDWDANIGNIVAGFEGSAHSDAHAIIMSVAASLYSNR